jgi:hypothetical protein
VASSIYYSAAWTECGCFTTCWHLHRTVIEAVACIRNAGGYVVAVQDGTMRSLTAAEECGFPGAGASLFPLSDTLEATPALTEAVAADFGYAVMIRIKMGDRWTWTTWMCFETQAEAMRCARDGMKVVRFRSPEWTALRQETEAASSAPQEHLSEQY